MLEQARKIVHTVVAYRYTFIRAFDGPTGQIASASPRKPAIFAGAVRSTEEWYARRRGVRRNYRDVPGVSGVFLPPSRRLRRFYAVDPPIQAFSTRFYANP